MVELICNPSYSEARQEDQEFKATLGDLARPYDKIKLEEAEDVSHCFVCSQNTHTQK